MWVGATGVLIGILCVACGGSSRRTGTDDGNGAQGGNVGSGGDVASGGSSAGVAGVSTTSGGTGGVGSGGSGGSGGDTSGSAGKGGPDGKGGDGGKGGSIGQGAEAGAPDNTPAGGKPNMPITSCSDDFPFLGHWEGNVLDFYFDPQQAVTLDIVANDAGEIVGSWVWGSGEPPPPPESADIAWPPGYWEEAPGFFHTAPPWPGVAYTVVRGAGCDETFRFSVATSELWQEWCSMQEPVNTPGVGWGCTYRGGGSSSQGECTIQDDAGNALAIYPLWKCMACGAFTPGVCACNENGCFASNEPTHVFDLAHSSAGDLDILSGKDPICGDCTVRLERSSR